MEEKPFPSSITYSHVHFILDAYNLETENHKINQKITWIELERRDVLTFTS